MPGDPAHHYRAAVGYAFNRPAGKRPDYAVRQFSCRERGPQDRLQRNFLHFVRYSRYSSLAHLHFRYLFLRESFDWARGWRCDLRKHRPGSPLSSAKPEGYPQKEAEGLRPRLVLWKDHRLEISRSAALSPCPGRDFKICDPLAFFEKWRARYSSALTARGWFSIFKQG